MIIVGEITTIQVSRKLKKELDAFKEHERESYAETINKPMEKAKENEEIELMLVERKLRREEEEMKKKGQKYFSEEQALARYR